MVHKRDILDCEDIEKLKKFALVQNKIIFYIAETISDVTKQHISQHEAIEDIKDYIYKHQDDFCEFPDSKDKVVLINDKKLDDIHDILLEYIPNNNEVFNSLDKIKEILDL